LLNELEEAGYLERRRDSGDRRRHRVFITDSGRQTLERAAAAQQEIEDQVLGALDGEERAQLHQLLARALRGAERRAPETVPAAAA
jgi:DNA-binding MarR family transcriptional regulator